MRVVVGVGCKRDCPAEEIITLIHLALEKSEIILAEVSAIASAWMKAGAENIMHAAEALDAPLLIIPQEKCEAVAGLAQTVSQKVVELYKIPSVAETAALAAAGKGAQLVLPTIRSASATCAIAVGK